MMQERMKVKIKYHNKNINKIRFIKGGDWCDLRAAETVVMNAGDFRIISLGIGMQIPEGYECHVVPRSSTYKNFHILMANSMGIIDNLYCGDDDIWGFPALAMQDTVINEGDRICQFRLMKKMEPVEFIEVDHLSDQSRGGFGSTGVA